MNKEYFGSKNNNFSASRKNQHKKKAAIILSLIVIISLVSISGVVYAFNTIKNLLNYDSELPCEDLPDIETVRQIVEEQQDVIMEIENINPVNVWVTIHERCNSKGELHIFYDTVYNKEKILEIIAANTFFGIPYRLFNV
jgi:hypothetical protein